MHLTCLWFVGFHTLNVIHQQLHRRRDELAHRSIKRQNVRFALGQFCTVAGEGCLLFWLARDDGIGSAVLIETAHRRRGVGFSEPHPLIAYAGDGLAQAGVAHVQAQAVGQFIACHGGVGRRHHGFAPGCADACEPKGHRAQRHRHAHGLQAGLQGLHKFGLGCGLVLPQLQGLGLFVEVGVQFAIAFFDAERGQAADDVQQGNAQPTRLHVDWGVKAV